MAASTTITLNDVFEAPLTDKHFVEISKQVYELTGIVLKPEKKPMVHSRLSRRLKALNFLKYDDYLDYLNGPKREQELPHLITAITTNLTKFFRENHHFEHLKEVALPALRGKDRIRIWSAGCSTGEEPYSIAMTVKETPNVSIYNLKILATDIDTQVVSHASQGLYQKADGISSSLKDKYCTPKEGGVCMSNELKSLITFKQLNLLGPWPMNGPFDIVFCRNTVIYFDKPTQQKLFKKMADVMPIGTYLYIGHSENLFNVSDQFKLVGQTIYQRVD